MFVGGMLRSIELESFEGEDLLFLYLSELDGEVFAFLQRVDFGEGERNIF